jgi:hypothetical protein
MNVEQLVERELTGETEVFGKGRPRAILSTRNFALPDLESNWGRRGVKPATNLLTYGTAIFWFGI